MKRVLGSFLAVPLVLMLFSAVVGAQNCSEIVGIWKIYAFENDFLESNNDDAIAEIIMSLEAGELTIEDLSKNGDLEPMGSQEYITELYDDEKASFEFLEPHDDKPFILHIKLWGTWKSDCNNVTVLYKSSEIVDITLDEKAVAENQKEEMKKMLEETRTKLKGQSEEIPEEFLEELHWTVVYKEKTFIFASKYEEGERGGYILQRIQ